MTRLRVWALLVAMAITADSAANAMGGLRDSIPSSSTVGFRIEIMGTVPQTWVLRNPRGQCAVIRGIASESMIEGCRVLASPDIISGDCGGASGQGSIFTVSKPVLGVWTLSMSCRSSKCNCSRGNRVRVVASKVERQSEWDILPALTGSDSLTWTLHVLPRSVLVERMRPGP